MKMKCIGGHSAGKWIDMDTANKFIRIPITEKEEVSWGDEVKPPRTLQVRYELYEVQKWHAGSGATAYVLVPQEQDPAQTMRALIHGYAPA